MRKKFNYLLLLYAISILVPVVVLLFLSFRNYSIESSVDKAYIIAKLTRDGLTTHMENGIMDKRAEFLAKIKKIPNVKNLRVLRSETVDKQFGKSFESYQKLTPLEKEVLKTGKEKEQVYESADKVELKIVIPYIASAYNTPNCLKCHQAREGEVLGAISMDFDITDVRESTLSIILKILLIIIIFSVIAFILLNKHIARYVTFFENLKSVMKSAYEGDYSKRLRDFKDKELHDIAKWINALLEKIENNLTKISKSVRSFVTYTSNLEDPLEATTELVEELASIYRFKNIIDKDRSVEQIYRQLGELLVKRFGINKFCIYEVNKKDNVRYIRYEHNYELICKKEANENVDMCRAYRTKEPVFSQKHINVCDAVVSNKYQYICFPIVLSEDITIVFNIITDKEEEYQRIKGLIGTIGNYLKISQTSLQTKLLMEELQTQSLVDRMTGAYNRRFLDIFTQKNVPQALRDNISYTIMMLDIDHFKMVNDTYGHDAGDKVIQELVKTIKENIRDADIVVRFGGEEFLVLLHNCRKKDGVKVAEKIRKNFENKRINLGSTYIQKTVSIGLSEFPTDTDQFWQAIKFADMALYKAKEEGRNRVVVFDPKLFPSNEEY